MWTVTVKTLDSTNHKFEDVDPDKSVADFKTLIAPRVNVDANRQRLIFCGRVLQDAKKISEYDVNGRVIHLVQRPPPSQGPDRVAESEARASSRGPSPSPRGRIEHIHVHTQDIPLPHFISSPGGAIGQSSPLVRLNVAREMLRQANRMLDRLDNPSGTASETQTSQAPTSASGTASATDTVSSAMNNEGSAELSAESAPGNPAAGTASFSAGPIHIEMMSIPVTADGMIAGGGNAPPGLAEALSAMLNGMGPRPPGVSGSTTGDARASTTGSNQSSPGRASAGVPASGQSGTASTAAEPGPQAGAAEQNPGMRIRHPPPEVLAEVMEEYQRTNARLVTHQNNLIPILRNDATYDSNDEMNVHQTMFNSISQITHFLSHAQHAMSDITLNFSRPPPRQLRARVFVIPSVSAVVQAGPISVNIGEATLGGGRTSATTNATTNSSARTSSTTTSTSVPTTATRSTSATASSPSRTAASSGSRSFPIPGGFGSFVVRSPQHTTTTSSSGPSRTANDEIQALLNNAMQQAFRSVPSVSASSGTSRRGSSPSMSNSSRASQGTQSSSGTGTGRAQGPPIVPLSSQMGSPVVGNLNSFDPFLPCSSHHIPNPRTPTGGSRFPYRVPRTGRNESANGTPSRTSSLDRRSTVNRPRAPPSQGTTWVTANPPSAGISFAGPGAGGAPPLEPFLTGMGNIINQMFGGSTEAPNQEDLNVMSMIQGVMGQVANSMSGQHQGQTIAQFLNSLPDYNYVEGESMVIDLLMTLAQHINFSVSIYLLLMLIFFISFNILNFESVSVTLCYCRSANWSHTFAFWLHK